MNCLDLMQTGDSSVISLFVSSVADDSVDQTLLLVSAIRDLEIHEICTRGFCFKY